jgi:hypothetical protein
MPIRTVYIAVQAWVPPRRPHGGPGRPVDPDYGVDEGEYPDQGLPPGFPGYPDQGLPGSPAYPDQGLPGRPPRPDQGLPIYPGLPGQGLPIPPVYPGQGLPRPPRPVDPDWGYGGGEYPDQGLPGRPPRPDQGLPGFPGRPSHPLPPSGRWQIYPVVTAEDLGGHPDLPDLNAEGQWERVAVGRAAPYPAYVQTAPTTSEPKLPTRGTPGTWVTIAYLEGDIRWAWVPSIEIELPEEPEVSPPDPTAPDNSLPSNPTTPDNSLPPEPAAPEVDPTTSATT